MSVKLRFKGFPHTALYESAVCRAAPGDVVEVSREEAQRMLADFPGAFELAEEQKPTPRTTVAKPASDVMAKSSPRKRAATRSRRSSSSRTKKSSKTPPE